MMVQKVITVKDELIEEFKVQLLGGSRIGFPEGMSFQGSLKDGQSRR